MNLFDLFAFWLLLTWGPTVAIVLLCMALATLFEVIK